MDFSGREPSSPACRPIRWACLARQGFSLIEVTLALGIMAFAGLAILGLISTGHSLAARSADTAVTSRLAVEVQAELQEAGVTNWSTNTTFFDGEGRVTNASGRIYEVCRTVLGGSLPGTMPGTNALPLKSVVVQIFKNPGGAVLSRGSNGLISGPNNNMDERTYVFHVAAQ
jgi:uncharacterized protein (TIGR02598 family)